MKPLVIVGAGGFAREVYYLVQEINQFTPTWEVLGFIDDISQALAGKPNYPAILGGIENFKPVVSDRPVFYANAIGNPEMRKKVTFLLECISVQWATLIHPTASIGPNSTVGEGCILARLATVTCDVQVGRQVHMNVASSCGHDSRIGDFCTLSAHVDVNGSAELGAGVFLGSHAVVLPKAQVGAWARIGAGSVALRSVKAGDVIMGVPGKVIFSREINNV